MATAARLRTFRMFPPAGHNVFTVQRGAFFDATTNGYVDALPQDADALEHAGWTRVTEIGATAGRPVPGQSSDIPGHIIQLRPGYAYYDTTLSATVFWSLSKQTWVNFQHTVV
jgi:hypothetical protein